MTTATRLGEPLLKLLRSRLRGQVLTSADRAYDEARRGWNGRFDRHPAAIVRCVDAGDVQAAVLFAREHDLPPAVRSGGHDFAGNSTSDGGLVIDLSLMNHVSVDPSAKRLRVEPGARWAQVDAATQAHGLATTGGTVSTVGVAGFILGGGSGYLSRKFGLGLDNLLAADIVTADGRLRHVSSREHADLFWALRGGSGNFGIVTALELQLHGLGAEVTAGQIIHALDDAPAGLRFYRDFMRGASDDIQGYAFFIRIPPIPAFPEALHGQVVLDLVVAHAGDQAEAERALAPLRGFGSPALDTVARVPYTGLQQAFDAGMASGNRWYSRSHYLRDLNDDAIETIVSRVASLPGAFSMVYLGGEGGASGRAPADATAYPHRDATFFLHMLPGLDGSRRRRGDHAVDAGVPRGDGAARDRRRLRQHAGWRRRGWGRVRVRIELFPAACREEGVRSGQPVPGEPQHRPRMRHPRRC